MKEEAEKLGGVQMGEAAYVIWQDVYKVNPDRTLYCRRNCTCRSMISAEDANNKLTKLLKGLTESGWTVYEPGAFGKIKDTVSSGGTFGGKKETYHDIDDGGNEIRVFEVEKLEKYMPQSNNVTLKVYVKGHKALYGTPKYVLNKPQKDWFENDMEIGDKHNPPPGLMKCTGNKNDEGEYVFVKEFIG